MQLRVYEKISMMPNGDRDTRSHPSSAFKVVLVNGERRTTIFSNDQFDHFWTHIDGSRQEYLDEAMDAANKMALTLGACEIVGVEITKHEARAEELREDIRVRQEQLDKLERKIR